MAIVQAGRRDIKQKGGTRQPLGLGKWQKFVCLKEVLLELPSDSELYRDIYKDPIVLDSFRQYYRCIRGEAWYW